MTVACDANPDGCMQCAKAKRPCPGYRVQIDLIFRDQSQDAASKVRTREARTLARKKSAPTTPAASSVGSSPSVVESVGASEASLDDRLRRSQSPPEQSLVPALQPLLEEQATCYFVSGFVAGTETPGSGLLYVLEDLYRGNAQSEGLVACVKAASYASFAQYTHNKALEQSACQQYVQAIRMTNTALQSAKDAKHDSTLLSVMILGLYEMISATDTRSVDAWAEHVNGAAALLKLRGDLQFKGVAQRRLFTQVAANILLTCLQRSLPVPDHIVELYERMAEQSERAFVAIGIFRTMMAVGRLRGDKSIKAKSRLKERLAMCLALDAMFATTNDNPPPEFQYTTHYVSHDPTGIAYKGRFDLYGDLWSATMFNSLRSMRVLLHEDIREVYLTGLGMQPPIFTVSEFQAQLQESARISWEMQAGILCSVPQLVGFIDPKAMSQYAFTHSKSSHPASDKSGVALAQSGSLTLPAMPEMHNHPPTQFFSTSISLLWNLWLAGAMDVADEESRQYATKTLEYIGRTVGVRQAAVIADMLRTKKVPESWITDPTTPDPRGMSAMDPFTDTVNGVPSWGAAG